MPIRIDLVSQPSDLRQNFTFRPHVPSNRRECAADRPISIATRVAKVDPDFLRLITPVTGRAGGRKLIGRVGGPHHGEQLRWRPSPVSVPDVTAQRLSKVASGFSAEKVRELLLVR
jgi:hypothetical protein